jgi:hypothetical protein
MIKVEVDNKLKHQFRDVLVRAIQATKEYQSVKLDKSGDYIIVRTYDAYEFRIRVNVAGYEMENSFDGK